MQQQQQQQQSLVGRRRGARPPHGSESPLWFSLLRRCLPCLALRRQDFRSRSRVRRLLIGVLLFLLVTLVVLTGYLLYELPLGTISPPQVTSKPSPQVTPKGKFMDAAAVAALMKAREEAMVREWGKNGFRPTYWGLDQRTLPGLTRAALESWFEQARAPSPAATDAGADALAAAAARAGANANADADEDLLDALALLYPPAQQRRYYRAALDAILRHGTRVGGATRDAVLRHLVEEGLGRRRFDAARRVFHADAAPHLSPRGQELLEKAAGSWPAAPHLDAAADGGKEEEEGGGSARLPGWRWSLVWDNFTTDIPVRVEGRSHVDMQNLILQFPGGSQFRRKQSTAAADGDEFVGSVPLRARHGGGGVPDELLPVEQHPGDRTGGTVYTQETFLRNADDGITINQRPALERGVPGTRAVLSPEADGASVPLKPSLSARSAAPAVKQPMRHVVLAAHWDSKYFADFSFLGACDSAVPVVFLLRTIKNIAALTDVAEALTESYKAERRGGGDGAVVPGLTHSFRNATTEADVRERLASLLSPAHHALLYQYFFARPYTVRRAAPPSNAPAGAQTGTAEEAEEEVVVDVRMWLDWVQHLPAISVILFDGEEAYVEWVGNDNTYGSRHLARRWRRTPSVLQTRYSGGPQSLLDSVDLFALYDLMGTPGTTFQNLYPTQSGIFYAQLAQREAEQRRQAMRDTSAITVELLWRYHGAGGKADPVLGQLGASPAAAVESINVPYARRVLASNPSRTSLPGSWLLYGTPHEMHTLHGLPRTSTEMMLVHHFERLRTYHKLSRDVAVRDDFDAEGHLIETNGNIFFDMSRTLHWRRPRDAVDIDDDHKHWLDTQRVLHLIPVPFPRSWHTAADNGSEVDDGTSTDLARVLWSTVLELGDYWTRKE
ncbi:glutaminyl cyclase [Novymonas esmeraldas]|uniref:Glutaminyl cyclase n=1 Tax=Novymonas esmeraldas TaxID=1808958 RepID=A0AAW0EZ58_9TRYP